MLLRRRGSARKNPGALSHQDPRFAFKWTPQQKSHVMKDDIRSEPHAHPNHFHHYDQVANEDVDYQNVLRENRPVTCRIVTRYLTATPRANLRWKSNLEPQDFQLYTQVPDDIRYWLLNDDPHESMNPDTTATNPLFRNFPDALTSVSTTIDHEPNIHDRPGNPYSIQPSTNNIKDFLK